MADKTPEQEPSIEEILASIRQIISDDDEKAEEAVQPVKEEPRREPEPVFSEPEEEAEDVLELTQKVEEEKSIEIDLQEHIDPPVQEEVKMQPSAPAAPSRDSDILTETARAATISSMAKLAGNMPITRHRDYGNITLEDLVREMLQPMLKDWMSDNLPPMVERMVQKELEKLARQAQDV